MTKKRSGEPISEEMHKQPSSHLGGLENKIMVSFRNGLIHQGNQIIGEIDYTLFVPAIRTIYHAEEKSRHNAGQYQKMLRQNQQHKEIFNTYFLDFKYERLVGLYLHDNNKIEVVK
jgi:hypothetical protein